MLKKEKILLLMLLTAAFAACSDEGNDNGNPCDITFDQTALFTHTADEIILPGYEALDEAVQNLSEATSVFVADVSPAHLNDLRSAFRTAWLTWQGVAQFGFGPAEQEALRSSVNPFPANTDRIDAHIAAGTWDLNTPMTFDKGFPALDYLLYGQSDPVDFFSNNAEARSFLQDNVSLIQSKSGAVLNSWKNGYRSTFINNTGTAAGTSLSQMVNSLNEYYEMIKRDKMGIPLGANTAGIPNPGTVEAPHSGWSLEFIEVATAASERYFRGVSYESGADGPGLEEYLNAADAVKNGESLTELINTQYETALSALEEIDAPLAEAVVNDTDDCTLAYQALVRQIVQIKTDMPNVLCVAITYIDNPSDSD